MCFEYVEFVKSSNNEHCRIRMLRSEVGVSHDMLASCRTGMSSVRLKHSQLNLRYVD